MAKDALERVRPTLDAIPADRVTRPSAPIDTTLKATRKMLAYARNTPVLAALGKVGVTEDALSELALRLDALELAQERWRERYDRGVTDSSLKEALERGYALRSKALSAAEFNLEGDDQAMAVLDNVREGEGQADLIEDLGVLAAFIEARLDAFKGDTTQDWKPFVASLRERAASLREGFAEQGDEEFEREQARMLRDRAALHAEEAIARLRRAGSYVFADDATARANFTDQYERARKRSYRARRDA